MNATVNSQTVSAPQNSGNRGHKAYFDGVEATSVYKAFTAAL